jgi:hypothetical protein
MRSLTNYVMAGFAVVLAIDVLAPLDGVSLPAQIWPQASAASMSSAIVPQQVNRAAKGDRLMVKASNSVQKTKTDIKTDMPVTEKTVREITPPRAIPEGCDPAFSPLAKSAKSSNYSSRCMADNSSGAFAAV